MIDGEEQEILLNTLAETPQEEVHTIEEDIYVIGVESLNGQAGDLTLKSINGENLVGEGNIALQTPLNQAQLNAANSGIDSAKVGQIATNATNITTLQNTKQDNLAQAQLNAVNSGIDATKVAQIATNTGNITSVTNRVTTIEGKIPSAASSSNKLTDKNYVDNAIATNTANYISDNGQPFQSYADLVAYSGPLTNNDYAFVETIDQAGNDIYTRYKYNADQNLWAEEYTITNPYFTSDQWASINSGIAANDVTQIGTNKTDIATLQTSKQDKLTTAQQAAVDSGIDATKVQQIATNATDIAALQTGKQDKLTAGTNIQINGTTISATDTKYTAGTGLTLTGTQFSVTEPVPSGFFTDTTTSQTSEGTDLTINGTAEAPFKDVKLKGDTFQQTYSGKNLARYLDAVKVSGATTLTFIDGGFRQVTTSSGYGTKLQISGLSSSTTYTLSFNLAVASGTAKKLVRVFEGTTQSVAYATLNQVPSGASSLTFATGASATEVNIWFYNGMPGEGDTTWTNIQLESGSTATAYEPYVGGLPSPSPEYPEPISVVTGEQTVKVTGKNLFDAVIEQGTILGATGRNDGAASRVRTQGYIPALSEQTYTISALAKDSSGMATAFCYKEDDTYIGRTATSFQACPCTFTTLAGTQKIRFAFTANPSGTIIPTDMSKVQLELGSTATAYEPYQDQSYPLTLGNLELCKIGDYQDYIWKDGDTWKIHKAVGKVVLDGSGTWQTVATQSTGNTFYATTANVDSVVTRTSTVAAARVFSDYFTNIKNLWNGDDEGVQLFPAQSNHKLRFRIDKTSLDTEDLAGAKAWFASHNTTVYYGLATSTDTAITDETLLGQLEALWNATSYNPQTNIASTTPAPNLPAILTIDTFKNNWAGTLAGYQETINRLEARVEKLEA